MQRKSIRIQDSETLPELGELSAKTLQVASVVNIAS
jgi:hypothetical protein